ncbi:MAG TPA: hypothetical protein VIT23_06395, partial [Terrimicrobiaceae bacterium]
MGFVYSPSATTENSETPTLLNSLFGTFNSPLRNSSNRPAEAKGHYVGADGYPKADANYGAE